MKTADQFNADALAAGTLTAAHVSELVRCWQREHGLAVDGKAGAGQTIPSINAALATHGDLIFPAVCCFPLRELAPGRFPRITSRHKVHNPERPTHFGCDLFYAYDAKTDPPMKLGDGGRTAKWWIPDETMAVAVADGKIVRASWSRTGFLVWLEISPGVFAGYMHLSRLAVSVGDSVKLGDPIGVVGDNPADHDARHLHFECYAGELDRYPRGTVDPELLLVGALTLPMKGTP